MAGLGPRATLYQFRDDPVMLDAFWQWAHNPTPVAAGLAWEENYAYIQETLTFRYALTPEQANSVMTRLRDACTALLDTGAYIYDLRTAIIEILKGELGEPLRARVAIAVDRQLSLAARACVAVLHWAKTHQKSQLAFTLNGDAPVIQALWTAVIGSLPVGQELPFAMVMQELMVAGVVQQLYRISGSRKYPWAGRVLDEGMIVPPILLTDLAVQDKVTDVATLVATFQRDRKTKRVEALREVACSYHFGLSGVKRYWQFSTSIPPELFAIPGVLGLCEYVREGKSEVVAAVNPLIRRALIEATDCRVS